MAVENKTILTRIINKNASLDAWNSSELPLKTGEIALAYVETTKPDGHGGTYSVPTYLMKVGHDNKKFSELEWLAAPASDVYDWAKKSALEYSALPKSARDAIETATADITTIKTNVTNLTNNKLDKSVYNAFIAADGAFGQLKSKVELFLDATANDGDALIDNLVEIQAALEKVSDTSTLVTNVTRLVTWLNAHETKINTIEAWYDAHQAVLGGITADKVSGWDNAAAKVHEHANKALLDTYTQTEANLADAVAKKHSHTFNETELNKIQENDVAKWNAIESNVAANYVKHSDTTVEYILDCGGSAAR